MALKHREGQHQPKATEQRVAELGHGQAMSQLSVLPYRNAQAPTTAPNRLYLLLEISTRHSLFAEFYEAVSRNSCTHWPWHLCSR